MYENFCGAITAPWDYVPWTMTIISKFKYYLYWLGAVVLQTMAVAVAPS